MKLFQRKPKAKKPPMRQKTRNIIGAAIAAVGVAGAMLVVAPAAQAATMHSCYIAPAGPDHHTSIRHGEVYASVNYTWFEETFLGYIDGVRYFGITSWDKVGTRPYWINGC